MDQYGAIFHCTWRRKREALLFGVSSERAGWCRYCNDCGKDRISAVQVKNQEYGR